LRNHWTSGFAALAGSGTAQNCCTYAALPTSLWPATAAVSNRLLGAGCFARGEFSGGIMGITSVTRDIIIFAVVGQNQEWMPHHFRAGTSRIVVLSVCLLMNFAGQTNDRYAIGSA
jgi:hypothetical protein